MEFKELFAAVFGLAMSWPVPAAEVSPVPRPGSQSARAAAPGRRAVYRQAATRPTVHPVHPVDIGRMTQRRKRQGRSAWRANWRTARWTTLADRLRGE